MSRCTKQHLSSQTAQKGSSQLKTQIRFLERCEGLPEEGGGSSKASGAGDEQKPLSEALRYTCTTRSHSCYSHSPDSNSPGGTDWRPIHTVDYYWPIPHNVGGSQGGSRERIEKRQPPKNAHSTIPPVGSSRTGKVSNQNRGCLCRRESLQRTRRTPWDEGLLWWPPTCMHVSKIIKL